MRFLIAILGLLLASGASAQTGGDPAKAAAAGDAVTLADLENATVQANITLAQNISRSEGQQSNTLRLSVTLTMLPGGKIETTNSSSVSGAWGSREGRTVKSSAVIDTPKESAMTSGDHLVWLFNNGTLTQLRTFKGGAYKREFIFARAGQGLTCKVRDAFVREVGREFVTMNSSIDNAPTKIISSTQTASTCRVSKR